MTRGFLIFLMFNNCVVFGQGNLVFNGSFEQRNDCPYYAYDLEYCNGWESHGAGSPDFYHRCSIGTAGIPTNNLGFQDIPFQDSAYAGVVTYVSFFVGGHETLMGELVQPLVAGTKYRIRLKANMADYTKYQSCCIGVILSHIPPAPPYSSNISDVELVIDSENYNTDDWFQLDAFYTAIGGESKIYIGNFRPESEMDVTSFLLDATEQAYFYIDDVEIYEDTLTSIAEELPMSEDRIRVYPNPSNGMLVVDILMAHSNDQSMSLRVTDLTGKTVYQSSMQVGMNRMELTLAPGSYLYSINDASVATLQNGKLVIVQ